MANKIKILLIVPAITLMLFIGGCNDPDQAYKDVNKYTDSSNNVNKPVDSTDIKNKTADSGRIHVLAPAGDTIYAGETDTTILLNKGEAFIKGHLTANQPKPVYTLTARKGQTVTALIRSMKKGGNVRINQIQRPNGTFDGPFGDSLHYTLKSNGKLRIIIGENLMAGDPYSGDFMLHITVAE